MKGFKLDHNGDVVITDKIEFVEGLELLTQTLKHVIATNLGEWFGDKDEGIDFYVVLTKSPNHDLIKDTINTAVYKVADSLNLEIETDNFTFDKKGRELTVSFTFTVNGNEDETASIAITL